jgi:NAD(P)H-dependent FMN reductase
MSARILVLSGSSGERSRTRSLVEAVEKALIDRNATTTHWDLRNAELPFADARFHDDPGRHPDATVREFSAAAREAHAFVLASPIYHNSFSGLLKNALDHLTIAHFQYKPVALISHGGNRSTQACDQLRVVVRGLGGVAIPTQVCTANVDYRETPEGYVLECEDILARVARLTTELAVFATALSPLRRS